MRVIQVGAEIGVERMKLEMVFHAHYRFDDIPQFGRQDRVAIVGIEYLAGLIAIVIVIDSHSQCAFHSSYIGLGVDQEAVFRGPHDLISVGEQEVDGLRVLAASRSEFGLEFVRGEEMPVFGRAGIVEFGDELGELALVPQRQADYELEAAGTLCARDEL